MQSHRPVLVAAVSPQGPNACRFCYDFGLFSVIDLQSLQPLPQSGNMEKSLAGLVWGCTGTT
jgi:dihydroorotate dehydrogenase